MSGRRVHPASGRTYHVRHNPPRTEGLDDETGEALIQRDDDREQIVRHRLAVYHEQTRPLVDYYCQRAQDSRLHFASIPGNQSVDSVREQIHALLREVNP
jgi:adenylate kinase